MDQEAVKLSAREICTNFESVITVGRMTRYIMVSRVKKLSKFAQYGAFIASSLRLDSTHSGLCAWIGLVQSGLGAVTGWFGACYGLTLV